MKHLPTWMMFVTSFAAAQPLWAQLPMQDEVDGTQVQSADGQAYLPTGPAPSLANALLVGPEVMPARRTLPETVRPAAPVQATQLARCDLNHDLTIDGKDLTLLMGAFGDCAGGQPCPADINGDGQVNQADVTILTSVLGRAVPAAPTFSTTKTPIGYVQPAPANLLAGMPIEHRADGSWLARVELQSAHAKGLRVKIIGLKQSGAQLRLYDPVSGAVRGPYAATELDDDGAWWSPAIFGDTIGLEFTFGPEAPQPVTLPVITQIAYIYEAVDGIAGVLSCHNDVTCFSSFSSEAKAVGLMSFISGGQSFVCTGALIVRQTPDDSPLFLTANHCISTQSEATSLAVFWLFQTSTCNGTPPSINTVPVSTGSRLLKRYTDADQTLLGMFDDIPSGLFRLGWTTSTSFASDSVTGIHHPGGSFKRISFGDQTGTNLLPSIFCDSNGDCITLLPTNTWGVDFDDGGIEGGSSGSPLLDSDDHIRGTCTGGFIECPNPDEHIEYGRFDKAFVNTKYYLADASIPSTVHVDGSVSGDSGGNGDSERGTSANPYNTVHEAFYAVPSGDTVTIEPGHYNEHITLWRAMTLTRSGTTGTVRIGAP